jgi:hypothetical protein
MAAKIYRFQTCYLCNGDRFLVIRPGQNYPCPLCGMDGVTLTRDGDPPPVPGRLVRTVLEVVKKRTAG